MLDIEEVSETGQGAQPGQQFPQHLDTDADADDMQFGVGLVGMPPARGDHHHMTSMKYPRSRLAAVYRLSRRHERQLQELVNVRLRRLYQGQIGDSHVYARRRKCVSRGHGSQGGLARSQTVLLLPAVSGSSRWTSVRDSAIRPRKRPTAAMTWPRTHPSCKVREGVSGSDEEGPVSERAMTDESPVCGQ